MHGAYDAADGNGRDAEIVRFLSQNDRYYLLYKTLNRIDVAHPWVYARIREVEAQPDGFCDIWARGHFKSTAITFGGCIQEILLDPEITIGIFSHTSAIAKGFLAQIQRELQVNENLKALFPDILYANPADESPRWSLDAGLIVKRTGNPKEATLEAHGLVDGMPTSKHFRLLLYDDVVTRESVNTPEQISKTTEAWELSDNLGTTNTRKQIIGTRYFYADTYAAIIERGAAKARIYPATHNGTLDGNPVLLSPEVWARMKRDQGEAVVSAQMLCNPQAGSQRMFDVRDVGVYEVRPSTLMVYILIDPARSMKKDSAHTAMVVVGVDGSGNKYLLDGYDHKMDLTSRWKHMLDLYVRWSRELGVQGVRVGYERYGAIADLDYFKERMQVEQVQFDITELAWPREGPGSKIDRVQRLTPDLKNHRLFVPYPSDPERLTKHQRKAVADHLAYTISQAIEHLDDNREAYDLTERLKMQLSYFPFTDKKDIVDALSRIYDMEIEVPQPPISVQDLEPEMT